MASTTKVRWGFFLAKSIQNQMYESIENSMAVRIKGQNAASDPHVSSCPYCQQCHCKGPLVQRTYKTTWENTATETMTREETTLIMTSTTTDIFLSYSSFPGRGGRGEGAQRLRACLIWCRQWAEWQCGLRALRWGELENGGERLWSSICELKCLVDRIESPFTCSRF